MRVQDILDPALPDSVIGINWVTFSDLRYAAEPPNFSFEWKRQMPFVSKERAEIAIVYDEHRTPLTVDVSRTMSYGDIRIGLPTVLR